MARIKKSSSKIVKVLLDVNAGFLVDIRCLAEILYSHSLKYVLKI